MDIITVSLDFAKEFMPYLKYDIFRYSQAGNFQNLSVMTLLIRWREEANGCGDIGKADG